MASHTLTDPPGLKEYAPLFADRLRSVLDSLASELKSRRALLARVSLRELIDAGIICRKGPKRFRMNFGRTYRLTPAFWARPRSIDELQQVVTFACQQHMAVKPVGALYTWSPVARPEDLGIALLTDRLTGIENPEFEVLKPRSDQAPVNGEPVLSPDQLVDSHRLVRVGSGTTLNELSADLHTRGLALKTMGAFGNERVGGAFNTGTHGSSVHFGPICDSVVSIDLVWQGVRVRVEPSNGPTDPDRFSAGERYHDWLLVQNDELFSAALLSYGTLGIAASYLMEVAPLYFLDEHHDNIGRESVREEIRAIVHDTEGNLFTRALSGEFYFNLFSTAPSPGGVRIRRILIPPPIKLPRHRFTLDEIIFRVLGAIGVDPGTFFTRVFRTFPRWIPAILEFALEGLKGQYRNVSYRVYNMGSANLTRTLVGEIGIPAEHVDAYLDDCTVLARRLYDERGWILTAPIAVRFVKPSRGMLAVQQSMATEADGTRRPVRLWAMVNFTLTIGTPNGEKMLQLFHDASLKYSGRSHPGKCHFDPPEHMQKCYDLDRFMAIRDVVDPEGCFLNAWNREILGISSPRATENAA